MELKDLNEEENAVPNKKARLWSAKEFRNKLKTVEKITAIQDFLEKCRADSDNYVVQYLENGGNCMELIQLLAVHEIPSVTILEILNFILLQIISSREDLNAAAYDSCKFFIQTHLASINKMLALGSPRKDKKVILKLLTTIVTFSKNLAKEILLHANLNPSNVEVLTKQTEDKESVRHAFIHFLMSFLVEGEISTILIFLDKRNLLTSIFRGLQYDSAEIVSLVMSTLETYILENAAVNKTIKMSVFSTPVIKDIVNLYNWKGPQVRHVKKIQETMVDPTKKATVSECVHSFLLVLCTSHKYGIVFKDPFFGLRSKACNNLMYTVLDSLERPWEHSYARELVTKICGACPDLVKTMWSNLKTFLEPRHTEKWLRAVEYAIVLLKELQPNNIELCTKSLNVQQIGQVVQTLVAPSSILQTIIPKDIKFEKPIVKHRIVMLLVEFLTGVKNHLNAIKQNLDVHQFHTLRITLNEYIFKYFLKADVVIKNWTQSDDEPYSIEENIKSVLQLLSLYEETCPQLLEGLTNIDLRLLLDEIPNNEFGKVQLVKLFLNYEPSLFIVTSDLFAFIFPLILQYYFETKDRNAYLTLHTLLNNSGIFEGSENEIEIWIDTIFYLSSLQDVCDLIVSSVRETSKNICTYISEMREMDNVEFVKEKHRFQELLESIQEESYESGDFIKSTKLSPMLIGVLTYISMIESSRNCRNYLNAIFVNLLHLQTSLQLVLGIASKKNYQCVISKPIQLYINGWANGESSELIKTKLVVTQGFSSNFLNGDTSDFFNLHAGEIEKPGHLRNCLNQALFYFTHLQPELLTEQHVQNCLTVIKRTQEFTTIFKHPIILQRFSPASRCITNRLLAEVIILSPTDINLFLKPFRTKLLLALEKILNKRKKWSNIMENLECIGLEHTQCIHLLEACSNVEINQIDDFSTFYHNVLVYALEQYLQRCDVLHPLGDNIIIKISQLLSFFNRNGFDTSTVTSLLHNYLKHFPHNIFQIHFDIFESILMKADIHKEDCAFAGFLLNNRRDVFNSFEKHFENVFKQKSLILILLKSALSVKADDAAIHEMYKSLEPIIIRALEKPKKASQHFETYKDTLVTLITKFMALENCQPYIEKVHKIETAQTFHIHLFCAIFEKILENRTINENQANNMVITLATITNYLFKRKDKSSEDLVKLNEAVLTTIRVYTKLVDLKISFRAACENDSVNLYCTLCLKFGLSGNVKLIKLITVVIQLLNLTQKEAQNLLEMTGSHSEFLEILLGVNSDCKTQLLKLILGFCKRWPSLMQKTHVPVLLSAYQGTVCESDHINLTLLQMYEKEAQQTSFYDFKPFLWGKTAASHYSVRQDIQRALWRQPRMHNILEILEESKINNTICNHPLDETLTSGNSINFSNENVYSLAFFLPLFASLLAPENQVSIHMFIKSGALSLTIVGLSCDNKEMRLASCHVLARFHYHLEARHGGKDRILRLSFIEALCRGVATLDDFKLNNFVSIFWAKMAVILTRPLLPMYLPLSRYLTAKPTPDLSGIPELYTFLHIPDVNFKDPRSFVLKVLRDGMRTDHDCSVASYKMAFKLVMELFSSCISDLETKINVLKVIERASKLMFGQEVLSTRYGLLSWLYEIVSAETKDMEILSIIIQILSNLTKNLSSSKNVDSTIVQLILVTILDYRLEKIPEVDLNNLLKVILEMFQINSNFLTEERLQYLISLSKDKKCSYLLKFGCKFTVFDDTKLMQVLVRKWINK